MLDHGGGYARPSRRVGVEVLPSPSPASETAAAEEEEEKEEEGGNVVVLRRDTSCRVRCRLRFFRRASGGTGGEEEAQEAAVHLRVALPPPLLTREVLPVVSLPIRLLPLLTTTTAAAPSAVVATDDDCGSGIDARLGINGCRIIYLPALGRALLCAESPGQAGIAGKVRVRLGVFFLSVFLSFLGRLF